jgi:hypothetical protein
MEAVTAIGLAASLVQLVEATTKTLSVLNDIRNAPKERVELAQELAGLLGILMHLRYRVEVCKPKGTWFAAIRFMGVPNGPLQQLQDTLRAISSHVCVEQSTKNALLWPFKKIEVQKLLAKLERLKALINLAFQEDLS